MATRIYNEDRLESFLANKIAAQEVRPLLIADLGEFLLRLRIHFQDIEERISSDIYYFSDPKIKRTFAARDLILRWQSVDKRQSLFVESLKSPEWRIRDKRTNAAPERLKWPVSLQIRRIFNKEVFDDVIHRRNRLKTDVRELKATAEILKKVHRYIEALPCLVPQESNTQVKLRSVPRWVNANRMQLYSTRESIIDNIVTTLKAAASRLDVLDDQLEDLMLEFNSIGERRHFSLAVKWKLIIQDGITIGSVRGPVFCILLINMQQGKRNIREIKKINREVIRESGFKRYEKEVMKYYKKINKVKKERTMILDSLKRIEHTLRHKRKTLKVTT